MNNISMNQALSIWDDLWQAYYGKNNYGGDEAEIYAYRLRTDEPTLYANGFEGSKYKAAHKAATSLYHLLVKFAAENNCTITIDNMPLIDWVESTVFDHRCHVKIFHS